MEEQHAGPSAVVTERLGSRNDRHVVSSLGEGGSTASSHGCSTAEVTVAVQ
jgi:hypothetical protein